MRRFARWNGLAVLGIGVLCLTGWMTGLLQLASVAKSLIPMAPSTAFAFILLGLTLVLATGLDLPETGQRILLAGGGALISLLALANLLESVIPLHLGIDGLFVSAPAAFGQVPLARMSPLTAAIFLITGFSALLDCTRRGRRTSGALAALAFLTSLLLLLGYAYGMPLLYGGNIIPVALPTAFAFFLASAALIAAAGPEVWPLRPFVGDSARAVLLRTFLPVTLLSTLALGAVQHLVLLLYTFNAVLLSAALGLIFALVILVVISYSARTVGKRIDDAEQDRTRAQAALQELNQQLEERVVTRTLELREKNRQMEEDLAMAREMQMAMLPSRFPSLPTGAPPAESALRFFTFYYPTGAVSGDFFTVIPISETAAGIFICDVMGHGVRAALVTTMMRALVEDQLNAAEDPGRLLTRINRGLATILTQTGIAMFATGFFMVADVARSRIFYSGAGHPAPLHLSRNKKLVAPLTGREKCQPAMGLFPDARYETSEREITAGDLVMLFTDGLFEVEGRESDLYSYERLQEDVRHRLDLRPSEMFHDLISGIKTFSHNKAFEDDVCLVGVEVASLHRRNGRR